jgi:hypothetical protein
MRIVVCIAITLMMLCVIITEFAIGQTASGPSAPLPAEKQLAAPPMVAGYLRTETTALNWNKVFLREEFLPPTNQGFLFLERRVAGDWDRVRMRYRVQNWDITITQSFSLFGLQVERRERNDPATLDMAQLRDFVRAAILKGENVQLQATGNDGRNGGIVPTDESNGVPWLSGLRWRCVDNVGLVWFIKNDGMPSAAVKGFGDFGNTNWFSK